MTTFLIIGGIVLLIVVIAVVVARYEGGEQPDAQNHQKPHPHDLHRLADDGCPHTEPSLSSDTTHVAGDLKDVRLTSAPEAPVILSDVPVVVNIDHVQIVVGLGTTDQTYDVCDRAEISHNGAKVSGRQFFDDWSVALSNGKKLWAELELKDDKVTHVVVTDKV